MRRPTYSVGDYTDYADAYDAYYESMGGLANYFYYQDSAGNTIDPRQYIIGTDNFKKMSHEVRVATPQSWPFRGLVGAFYQRQTNHIYQDYLIDNLAPDLSVNGHPGTLWLTLQDRKDKDWALFGEASFDVTPQITLTAGGRLFKYDNSLFGFAGFGKNPNFDEDTQLVAPNAAWGSSGVRRCLTVNGLQLLADEDSPLAEGGVEGTPCTNVGNVVDGEAVPRRTKGNGFTHRLNAQYKPNDDMMFYGTWSRGFRPGGINRQPNAPAYDPDYLTNFELGWKTAFGPLRWNGAVFHQLWKSFQFSFLGENSLTVIQNGRDATVDGIETDVSYVAGGLTLNAAAAYTNAKTKQNVCFVSFDEAADCDTLYENDPLDPDDDLQDFIVTPADARLPVTPKFKATGNSALHLADGHRADARAGIAVVPDLGPGRYPAQRRRRGDGDRPRKLLRAGPLLDLVRRLRRLQLGEFQRRIVRDQPVRRAQRHGPLRRLRPVHPDADHPGTAADDRRQVRHQVLSAVGRAAPVSRGLSDGGRAGAAAKVAAAADGDPGRGARGRLVRDADARRRGRRHGDPRFRLFARPAGAGDLRARLHRARRGRGGGADLGRRRRLAAVARPRAARAGADRRHPDRPNPGQRAEICDRPLPPRERGSPRPGLQPVLPERSLGQHDDRLPHRRAAASVGTPWARPAAYAAIALSVLVGLSRVMLGVHWPSDVVGGWVFGLLWVLIALPRAERLAGPAPRR